MESISKNHQILTELRNNSRESLTRMSRKTGIPVSTLFNRIQENKSVYRNTCLLNFDELGYNARANALFKVNKSEKDDVVNFLLKCDSVNTIMKINGLYDFQVELVFKTIYELEEFVEKMKDDFNILELSVFYILKDIVKEKFMTEKIVN